MIGLQRGKLHLERYCDEWPQLFEEEAARIRAAVGCNVIDVQHVGSTSIPGMLAKPIIDIGIAVESFEDARICIESLQQIGYTYRGENGISRRHYFVKGNPRTHHIHMLEIASDDWKHLIRFRDQLRQGPELTEEYISLKRRLFSQFENNREAYQEGKASFIQSATNDNWSE